MATVTQPLTREDLAQALDDLRISGVTDRVTASCSEAIVLDHDLVQRERIARLRAQTFAAESALAETEENVERLAIELYGDGDPLSGAPTRLFSELAPVTQEGWRECARTALRHLGRRAGIPS